MTMRLPPAGWYPDPTGKPGQTDWDGPAVTIRQLWTRENTGLPSGLRVRKIALAGLGIAALTLAPLASADPTVGHDAKVNTQTPPMLCEIGSVDADPGVGPSVICQGSFVQAPAGDDQAFVTASGKFSYRSANIGVGSPHARFDTLVTGQTSHVQGWTVVAGGAGIRFTNDGTGHGMSIGSDTAVNPF
jgi:hypothetical protein